MQNTPDRSPRLRSRDYHSLTNVYVTSCSVLVAAVGVVLGRALPLGYPTAIALSVLGLFVCLQAKARTPRPRTLLVVGRRGGKSYVMARAALRPDPGERGPCATCGDVAGAPSALGSCLSTVSHLASSRLRFRRFDGFPARIVVSHTVGVIASAVRVQRIGLRRVSWWAPVSTSPAW